MLTFIASMALVFVTTTLFIALPLALFAKGCGAIDREDIG